MHRKKHNSTYKVQYYSRFQTSIGGLGMYPLRIRGDYCSLIFARMIKHSYELCNLKAKWGVALFLCIVFNCSNTSSVHCEFL